MMCEKGVCKQTHTIVQNSAGADLDVQAAKFGAGGLHFFEMARWVSSFADKV